MSGFPGSGPWPLIRKDLTKTQRKPVVAAVGYIGAAAPAVMPLRRGDILVCDASDVAVRSRLTNAAALATYHRSGVAVFSLEGLHAKVIASPKFAWIGSANASNNSEQDLVEASVRVVGDQAASLHEWAANQATEDRGLSLADIRRLETIKLSPYRPGPKATLLPIEVPPGLKKLRFIETEATTTKADDRAIDSDLANAKTAARAKGLPTRLRSVIFPNGATAKKDDWVIDIRGGHARPPAVVVRVGNHQRGDIIWLSEVRAARRPRISEMRALHAKLEAGFDELVIKNQDLVLKILALYS